MAARMAMMTMTMRSSMMVKACDTPVCLCGLLFSGDMDIISLL